MKKRQNQPEPEGTARHHCSNKNDYFLFAQECIIFVMFCRNVS
jgi:hypothetical protein